MQAPGRGEIDHIAAKRRGWVADTSEQWGTRHGKLRHADGLGPPYDNAMTAQAVEKPEKILLDRAETTSPRNAGAADGRVGRCVTAFRRSGALVFASVNGRNEAVDIVRLPAGVAVVAARRDENAVRLS